MRPLTRKFMRFLLSLACSCLLLGGKGVFAEDSASFNPSPLSIEAAKNGPTVGTWISCKSGWLPAGGTWAWVSANEGAGGDLWGFGAGVSPGGTHVASGWPMGCFAWKIE
jgi:hypothetical protein